MNIFLTNDDGYQATGIRVLYGVLVQHHNVVMVAPDREKSAVSHGITLHHPMRLQQMPSQGKGSIYAMDGTPADCVKLGLSECVDIPPDMVISGINPGTNIGIDINYSGTVAAAREGALNGIMSLAVSMKIGNVMDYEKLARFISDMAETIRKHTLPSGTFLNINAPGIAFSEIKGVKTTCQAFDNLSSCFEKRKDPKHRRYYWYGSQEPVSGAPDTDVNAIAHNYISITPLRCDLTDYNALAEMPVFAID